MKTDKSDIVKDSIHPLSSGLSESRFSISLLGSDAPALDVFGLWEPASLPAREGGPGDRSRGFNYPAEATLFHADLPADPDLAFDLLDSRESALRLARKSLPTAGQHLTADLRELSLAGAGGASFAIGEGGNAGARAILAAGLQHQGRGESFGLFDGVKIDPLQLDQAAKTATSFADQVRRVVDQLALVETTSGGQRLGRTRAAWSGDVETWWSASASRDQRLQHEQVFAQALAIRQDWLSFLLLVAGGITRVAATLAAGPFSLVTVWTTWNYLQEVVKEYKNLTHR